MAASGTVAQARTVYLSDYRPPDYAVDRVHLDFLLDEKTTRVRAHLEVAARARSSGRPLVLDGHGLELRSVVLDGRKLAAGRDYQLDADHLTIPHVPGRFVLDI
ncbi:MAG: aminopeptidase N, partial [Gammaproteobacteria bacterium]|nr:aminopeptidase N [Gammaproteobacteria bacterium]